MKKNKIKNWKNFFKFKKRKISLRKGYSGRGKKKSFWGFLKIKKKRKKKDLLRFFRVKKRKIPLRKGYGGRGKKKNKSDNKIIQKFLFGIILALFFAIGWILIEIEAVNSEQKIKNELNNLHRFILAELELDFLESLNQNSWSDLEDKKSLAEKVRHLNYLNAHLQKVIDEYYQDWTLKTFYKNKKELDKTFNQAQNAELISNRIANKIDSLLLFDKISENQLELLKKDFSLFYDKVD